MLYVYAIITLIKEKLKKNPTYNFIKKNKTPRDKFNNRDERTVYCKL